MTELARITSYPELVEALRRRKAALHMADLVLDEVAGLCAGHFSKIAAGERGIGATTLFAILDALGLSVQLVEDAAKMAARGEVEHRDESHVRNHHPRVGKDIVKRARPVVLQEAARKAASARWA